MIENGNARFPFRSGLCPKVNHLIIPFFRGIADFLVGPFTGYETGVYKAVEGRMMQRPTPPDNGATEEKAEATCTHHRRAWYKALAASISRAVAHAFPITPGALVAHFHYTPFR
jgi:hypothetical protein